ncbi:DUF4238 domain-containing protein [Candidatus Poriferisodalis sp.]|uniref:DUF4238 domain-containing protein n=1 Tax=Candidatus Poriferisodalis sp. TaxID=3101277 RepID=UPI003B028B2E
MLPRLSLSTREARGKVEGALEKIDGSAADERSPREHHFIPQFWLRQFAEKGMLCVLSRDPACAARRQSVKSTSVERDLYTTYAVGEGSQADGEPDDAVPMERMLGVFEHRAADVLHRLVGMADGRDVQLSDLDRYWMSILIALQIARPPQAMQAMRDAQASSATQMMAVLARRGGPDERMKEELAREASIDPSEWDDFEWSPDDFLPGPDQKFDIRVDPRTDVAQQISIAFDTDAVMPVFARWWNVITLPEPILPIPLDQGVFLLPPQGAPFPWNNPGLLTAEEIWAPLSPRVLLLAHWNGPDARHQPATGEQYAARLATKRSELACRPSTCERVRRVAVATRSDNAAELAGILGGSNNVGQQHATFM